MSVADSLTDLPSQPVDAPPYSFFRLPILFGPLCGYGWIPASGGKLLRILLGTYEREQTALFQELVRPGDEVLDIGAANGYYTLLAAQLTGPQGRVTSFEPDSVNAAYLRKHVSVNGLKHVSIHEWAIGNQDGIMRFGTGSGTGTGRLTEDGQRQVLVRRLDDLFPADDCTPNHLKIDVEGAEVSVLHGGERLIQRARPTIFLSTHHPSVHQECCRILKQWNYSLSPIIGGNLETTTEVLARPSAK